MNLLLQLRFYVAATFLFGILSSSIWGQNGSVIVIQTKGVVEAISPTGVKLVEPVVRGSVLPVGYGIKTGLFAESVLLLSNGTTATIQENSTFKLTKFDQAPFDAQGNSFGQLNAEPSTSQVSFDMEVGSLVVQTKKLNKASSLTISTPTGTAGIRGTQFQMAMSPASGMKLDVAESQVAFTPTGQNQPIVVGAGKGLDASPSGQIKQRPISPSASQNISSKNAAANAASAKISVTTAKQANAKAEQISGGENEDETTEEAQDSKEESESSDDASSDSEVFLKNSSSTNLRDVSGQEVALSVRNEENKYLELIKKLSTGSYKSDETDDSSNKPGSNGNQDTVSTGDIPPPPNPGFTPLPPVDDYKLIFNDLGNLDLIALDVFGDRLGLPIELTDKNREDLETTLESLDSGADHFAGSLALEAFLKHATLQTYNNDNVNESFRMAWFISSLFFHELTDAHSLVGEHELVEANWGDIIQGKITPGAVLNAKDLIESYRNSDYLYDLGVALIDEGALGNGVTNNEIALDLLNHFGGSSGIDVPNAFTLGSLSENGNDYLFNSALLGASHNDLIDAEDSPEKQAELDRLFKVYTRNINAVVGSEIHIGDASSQTTINVGQWLQKATTGTGYTVDQDNKIFAFVAGKDLHLAGNVKFENSHNGVVNKSEDHALVLGSAQNTVIGSFEGGSPPPQGSKLYFEGSNLGIGSYEDLTVINVDIDVGGNLAIGTLGDLSITESKINVGRNSDRDNVYMYAEDLLSINDLMFSNRTREIYMEANTIDLRSVHFPGNSEVMLRSRDGAPYFYGPGTTNASSVYKPFHVNFYSDSNTYGGTEIIEGEFKRNGTNGYNSNNFRTNTGDSAIKIRAIPQ